MKERRRKGGNKLQRKGMKSLTDPKKTNRHEYMKRRGSNYWGEGGGGVAGGQGRGR